MKKTIIAAALLAATSSAAQATVFDFAGTFQMRDPTGVLMQNDTTLTGTMDMDMGAGSGTASIVSSMPFFGFMWTAHNITVAMTGPTTAAADMLFDWGSTTNIHVTVDMGVTMDMGTGAMSFTTLDGPSADGIPGNPMDNGPFPMFNAAFLGTATPQASAVPVPAAVWLFGSGLVVLAGVARRRKAA